MIGLIISGHGNFASGLQTSLKLIAGETSNIEFIDFTEIDSIESLTKKYYTSLNRLENCDSILALSDLAGGSPFKTLVELKTTINKPMEVIAGTNLPMILEIAIIKNITEDIYSLCESALNIGKNGITKFEFKSHKDDICEGGI